MILYPSSAKHPNRSTHNRGGFSIEGIIAVRSGSSVDGVLQNSRDGIVVFWCSYEQSVCRLDFCLKVPDYLRRFVLQILVERGGIGERSKTSIRAFSGVSSTAARINALLQEPLRRLPTNPSILTFFSNRKPF